MEQQIIDIIAKTLNKNAKDINQNTRLVEDLGADSLDVVELLMLLEDEYGITIPDEEAVKLNTIGDITKFLSSVKK